MARHCAAAAEDGIEATGVQVGLTRDQWSQVEALFAEAQELPAAQRARWLERKNRTGALAPAVQAEVAALLAADQREDLPEAVRLLSPEVADESLPAGENLGPWKLLRLLGRGGMGEVYLAERADGAYEQQVALKLLKRGVDTDAVLRRFLRERRILGSLSHPNIARLLDAGAAPDGRPYLVMERVDGKPISEWGRQHAREVRKILEIMIRVCDAVHAAHRQLVVHRDLKPSNVLVGEDGTAKLLDFGIAKLLGEDESDATLTAYGQAPATPQYAAPEQLLGQPVTTASDVFSLGMLLYELLTGTLPPWRRNTLLAVAGVQQRRALPRPSQAVPGEDAQLFAEPAARRRRAKDLYGDLDQIVLKATEYDPGRRYAGAADLADDLRRHLDGRPVLARPDSWAYTARKYLVRNWLPVTAAAAVAAALVAGLSAALWQARLARAQALRAERVKDFVVSVFAEQDPYNRGIAARTPQQMLAAAAGRLDQELGAEPELHAELLDDLGGIQLDIGDLKGSEALLRRAEQERSVLHGAGSLEVAESLGKLALVLDQQGRYGDEQQAAQQELAILRAHRDADPLEVARAESALANATSVGKGAPPEAERLFRDALRIFEQMRGPDDPETLRTLYYFAETHEQARQLDLAGAEVDELILRSRRRYGEQSAAMGLALALQGQVLGDAYKAQAAVDADARAIAIFRVQFGSRNKFLDGALSRMATQLRYLRRFEDALATYAQAEQAVPEGDAIAHSEVRHGEGRLDLLLGRADAAELALRTAYQERRAAVGDSNGFTWYLASEWGRGLAAQGKLAEAEAVQREAVARLAAIMGPDAYQNALLAQSLAATLEREPGRRADAEALLRKALHIVEARFSTKGASWADSALHLARNLEGAGTAAADAEGLSLCEQAVASYRADPPDSETWAEALFEYSGFLDRGGRRVEARKQIADALEAFAHTQNPDAAALARAQALQRRLEQA